MPIGKKKIVLMEEASGGRVFEAGTSEAIASEVHNWPEVRFLTKSIKQYPSYA